MTQTSNPVQVLTGMGRLAQVPDPSRAPTVGASLIYGGASMAGSALYGGAIGGIAAKSWDGAGTGALAASGITGIGVGLGLTLAPAYGYDTKLMIPGILTLAAGTAAAIAAGARYIKG